MIIMKKIYLTLIALLASINMFAQGWPANYSGVMLLQDYYIHTLTDGVPTIGFTNPCHFLDKVLF
mgnify:CR=1 FL=1